MTTTNASDEQLLQRYNYDLRKTITPVTIFFGIEILFGMIGNICTIYVFLLRYKPCNFRYFVLGLAVIDLISCLTTIPGEIVSQLFWYTYPVPAVCKAKAYFNQLTVLCEAAYLTLIALDRYRKVCRPFGWQIQRKGAIYACIGIFVAAAIFMIQTPILWGVHTEHAKYEGRTITVTICETDQKYVDTKLPLANVLFVGVLDSIAVVCMLAMYIMVARRILARQKQLKNKNMKPKATLHDLATKENRHGTAIDTTSDLCHKPDNGNSATDGNVNDATSNDDKSQNQSNPEHSETLEERGRNMSMLRARRKSLMGFFLTVIFVVTTVLYWTLISLVAQGCLSRLNGVSKCFYLFFLRLYFVNHIINPVLYGLMDPQFRKEVRRLKSKIQKAHSDCQRSLGTAQQNRI